MLFVFFHVFIFLLKNLLGLSQCSLPDLFSYNWKRKTFLSCILKTRLGLLEGEKVFNGATLNLIFC